MKGTDLESLIGSDPQAKQQANGFWKFLDNLHESSPEEYKKFIDEQMQEMKSTIGKEKEEETKKQTIESTAAFCMRILIARKVPQT